MLVRVGALQSHPSRLRRLTAGHLFRASAKTPLPVVISIPRIASLVSRVTNQYSVQLPTNRFSQIRSIRLVSNGRLAHGMTVLSSTQRLC